MSHPVASHALSQKDPRARFPFELNAVGKVYIGICMGIFGIIILYEENAAEPATEASSKHLGSCTSKSCK